MWSIIKWLFLIAIVGGIILWLTGTKIGGRTIEEHAKPVLEMPMVKEGIHDIRQIVGEGLKAAGEAVSEDVTDAERKQLDNLVKQEMMTGKPIEGAPGQQALPPQVQPQTTPQAQAPMFPAKLQSPGTRVGSAHRRARGVFPRAFVRNELTQSREEKNYNKR